MRLRHPWLICRPLDPRLVADRWGRFIVAGLMIVSCARQDPMAAAQELLRKGETREAVELLRGAVEEDPADPRREHWYGYALIQNKQLALATWPLRRAMRDPAFTVKSGVLLARTFLKTDNAPDAERIATAVLEVEPEHRAARRIRARARINMSKEEAALEDLEVLLDEDPSQLSIHEMVLDSLIRLERIEEAQARLDLMAELVDEKGIGDPGARAHLCVRGANLKRHRQALEAANEAFEECLAAFPGNTEVVNQAVDFHRARGDRKRELETLRKAVEANPDDLQRLMQLSLELRADGRGEEAEGRLLEVAERLDRPDLWSMLRDYHASLDDLPRAIEMIERGLSAAISGDRDLEDLPPAELFADADLLIEAGEYERAEELMEALHDEDFIRLLRARMLHKKGRPREALDLWAESFRSWSSNPGARYLAAKAALEVGEWDLAIEHLRASLRADPAVTDAGVVLAWIHLAEGRRHAAQDALGHYLKAHPGDAEIHRVHANLCSSLGLPEYAYASRMLMARTPLGQALAIADTARDRARRENPAAALAYLDGEIAKRTGRPRMELVHVAAEIMNGIGRAQEALELIDGLIAEDPDSSLAQVSRGQALEQLDQIEAAGEAFERAVELDPESDRAHRALAEWLERRGRLAEAIDHYNTAARLQPLDVTPRYRAIALAGKGPDPPADSEVDRLEALLSERPWEGRAALRLAELRFVAGDSGPRTLALARRAYRFRANLGFAPALLLAEIQLARGETEDATRRIMAVAERDVGDPEELFRLGRALVAIGETARAKEVLTRAIQDEDFVLHDEARQLLGTLGKSREG